MAVPGYQDLMLPLLRFAADGREHTITEAQDAIAGQLGISEQDQALLLPSGTHTRYYSRVA